MESIGDLERDWAVVTSKSRHRKRLFQRVLNLDGVNIVSGNAAVSFLDGFRFDEVCKFFGRKIYDNDSAKLPGCVSLRNISDPSQLKIGFWIINGTDAGSISWERPFNLRGFQICSANFDNVTLRVSGYNRFGNLTAVRFLLLSTLKPLDVLLGGFDDVTRVKFNVDGGSEPVPAPVPHTRGMRIAIVNVKLDWIA